MPVIQENFSLKNFNTFGVDATARWFTEINIEQDLPDLFTDEKFPVNMPLILGGGSNMLFTKPYNGLVIHLNNKGIEVTQADEQFIYVTAAAGELWNDLVQYAVNNGYGGLENLSLIPGSVGASPVQNIGAYGVEVKDVLYECSAFEIATGNFKVFSNTACEFAYRDSIFKNKKQNQYIITSVTFKLARHPVLNIRYGAIQDELLKRNIGKPSLKDIAEVVAAIRVAKLPDPKTIGNAGSFFKNPVITFPEFRHLQSTFIDIVHFPLHDDKQKIAAGWLIEKCGFKGVVEGNTGTWKNQALVVVNHGNATGNEIFIFSEKIIKEVKKQFGVTLEREVNIH